MSILATAPQPLLTQSEEDRILEKCVALGDALPRVLFLQMRRNARTAHTQIETQRWRLSAARRTKAQLGASPFNSHRVEQLDAWIAESTEFMHSLKRMQEAIGRSLIDLAPSIDRGTTLDERLELLNCNRADRADLDKFDYADLGMVYLMAVHCVEDSAEHRNDEWNDRPLHTAVNAEIHRVMFRTPEGKAASDGLFDELFAPGGMFEKVPKYYEQADGTMLRQAPPLTVHDAAGSRVIERKPS
jgi:hypothetical protein